MFKNLKKSLKKKAVKAKPAKKVVKKTRVAKPPKRKVAAKKTSSAPKVTKGLKAAKPIGRVTHYYTNIKVAIIKFFAPPKFGSKLRFQGATTDFAQPLLSAQYDHKPVSKIPKGKQVGVKVKSRVREDDSVYLEK
jgi:hypothetical protein